MPERKVAAAVFGGGCFWCTEAVFTALKGVVSVISGYAGGSVEKPTYKQVCSGQTGHAEVVMVEYDPAVISYHDLLGVFFATHDPTTLNKQGNDVGTQYRSVIFTTSAEQAAEAEKFIAELNALGNFDAPIITKVEPLKDFYEAEEYHRDYYKNNPAAGYCQAIISPKLAKFRANYAHLLK
ncbi:MAG: peptide-methionine (S)-S-oxide reductase MsrA [Candidatus Veblenbacteria bacterium]|nr:peptide-methionine (S)-S-oxide reductase MsrA [Candidatus Veblenbacteria bacterium]